MAPLRCCYGASMQRRSFDFVSARKGRAAIGLRMTTSKWMLSGALVFATMAVAQVPGPSSAGSQASLGASHVYRNAALALTFSYPARLAARDASDADALGQRMVNGENTDPNAARSGPAPCTKTLLALGTGPGQPGAVAGLVARLTLFDIDLHCLPPKAVKNKKLLYTTLSGFAAQGVTMMGMMPIEEPAGYLLEGFPAYIAASQGTPVANTDLQSGESQVMAVVAVAANEHILAWMMDSNDLGFFNRMLASRVDFGGGQAQPLFAPGLHPE